MWPLLSCFVPHWVGNWSVEMRWWWVFLREPEDCIPRPPSVPPWDLEVVLRTLSQLSLEPLASVNMKDLSLKCALLLALALAKHIGDFHAFWTATVFTSDPVAAVSHSGQDRATCLITIYLSTLFWMQTILLSAFTSESSTSRDSDTQTSFGQLSTIWPSFRVLR